jgi:Zn-dependent protease
VKSAVVGIDQHQRLRRPSAMFFFVLALFIGSCVVAAFVDPSPLFDDGADPVSTPAARVAAIFVVMSGAVLGLVFHEWAHAMVAYLGGDKSVAEKGYLTGDVRHYSHPFLSIVMPICFLLLGGLPLPGGAVWIRDDRLRSKWWRSAVSIAGPAINLAGAAMLYGIVKTGVLDDHVVLTSALSFLAFIEVAMVVLNMLPIPGLDGYGVIEPHLPEDLQALIQPLRQFSFVLLVIFILSPASDFIFDWAQSFEDLFGVDYFFGYYGEQLASPRLYGDY